MSAPEPLCSCGHHEAVRELERQLAFTERQAAEFRQRVLLAIRDEEAKWNALAESEEAIPGSALRQARAYAAMACGNLRNTLFGRKEGA